MASITPQHLGEIKILEWQSIIICLHTVIGIFMRGTKKYKIVKCFRHFGAIIILLWLISIVRFPYSFDKLQVLSNKNFESVSNSMLTLVDCKSTES